MMCIASQKVSKTGTDQPSGELFLVLWLHHTGCKAVTPVSHAMWSILFRSGVVS